MTGILGPGEDIEAWCTRCRMNLNHRIIAVEGKKIPKVQCLTCGSDHKFHPPKQLKSQEENNNGPKTVVTPRTNWTTEKEALRAVNEWQAFIKEMPSETTARPYKISDSYGPDQFIDHPVFGLGRVIEVIGLGKVQVIFKEGRKILVCNKAKKI